MNDAAWEPAPVSGSTPRWLPALILAWLAYAAIGIGVASLSPALGGGRSSRWAAWFASAIVFGLHTIHEQRRLRSRPLLRITALRVAAAAALGAFFVAISANLHAIGSAGNSRILSALVIWPIAMMIVAFPVALTLAWIVRKR